ncbi:hypothetical protein JAAARDRAFT_37316 [Jaapia argillacea MUCL 33604]|uniref:G domain-containing protein n=1 Tax=Jaapia argillacea MUCL 33604 TaxID=933084 RepID=A0A067PLU9_9AGAM|nr:hypothetical protein JAAARDRAFT_37316 [Jaapia argillacea MUCL 33604]
MNIRTRRLREKYSQFRVLVMGKANAGKTTILQKVCNTTDQPKIYNSDGEEIDLSAVAPSRERGVHDIENEMIFEANDGYIFHDSRGFECGSTEEFKIVQDFIEQRGRETASRRQLHAIWYCLPTDNASRLLTGAEARFFHECDPGAVPVIAIYTKFDDFVLQTQQFFISQGEEEDDAFQKASLSASDHFTEEYAKVFNTTKFPPAGDVQLQGKNYMDKADTNCDKLLEKTADVLGDDALRQLFVCVQKNNLDLCGKWGVESTCELVYREYRDQKESLFEKWVGRVLSWYPWMAHYSSLLDNFCNWLQAQVYFNIAPFVF